MQKITVRFRLQVKPCFYISDLELKKGEYVIAETLIGQGYGKVEKIEEYNPLKEDKELSKILRKATDKDASQNEANIEREKEALLVTKELAEKFKLDMTVVNAEFSFDGTKVLIDFISENRVDFRDLVKELASRLKTRIELRQIGIRDQAKMVGGIGICGRMCCCSAHLKDFEKVSIKMAKSQGLALNPTKISGSCGRLMCCLAYEDNYYSEIYPKMPKLNKEVKTPDGIGTVIYTNALKQTVSVRISNDGNITIKDYNLENIKFCDNQNKNQIDPDDDQDEFDPPKSDNFNNANNRNNNSNAGNQNSNNGNNKNSNNNQQNNFNKNNNFNNTKNNNNNANNNANNNKNNNSNNKNNTNGNANNNKNKHFNKHKKFNKNN